MHVIAVLLAGSVSLIGDEVARRVSILGGEHSFFIYPALLPLVVLPWKPLPARLIHNFSKTSFVSVLRRVRNHFDPWFGSGSTLMRVAQRCSLERSSVFRGF